MFKSFQTRLVTIFVGLFFIVQLLIFLSVYKATTYNVVEQIKDQLSYARGTFERHLSARAEELAEGVAILTADFSFRRVISENDSATSLSVLRNLAMRIKADRVMLISLEGEITVDTQRHVSGSVRFPYEELISIADESDSAKAIIVLDEKLYDFVIVPILAPLPIAWLGVGIEIDDGLAQELRLLSPLDLDISFIRYNDGFGWDVIASTLQLDFLEDFSVETFLNIRQVSGENGVTDAGENESPTIRHLAGMDYVTLVVDGVTPKYSPQAIVFLQYSMDKAMNPYRPMLFWLKVLSLLGLLLAGLGSMLIARSVSRPVRILVDAAKKIEKGNYQEKIHLKQKDELGQLASAFNAMMDSISEREEKILYQSQHDLLSGLPNRQEFERILQAQIDRSSQESDHIAVNLIKIERLHEINNTLGHQIGDKLILEVCERLKLIVESGDVLAHVTKNTFILMSLHRGIDDGLSQAENIIELFVNPCVLDNVNIDVLLCIGKSYFPSHGNESKLLIQKADVAMYLALKSGKNYAIYDSEKDTYSRDNLSLMSELKSGLLNNEFQLYYQPKIDMKKKCTTHVEALIRWIHPVKGFMPPDDFIPLAEQSGHIHQLTLWVLEQAVRQCSIWHARGITINIAINISVKDLLVKNMPDIIVGILDQYHLKAEYLVLEITESSIMTDPEVALIVLNKLRNLGLRISIDDFGTGYSSMEYLKRLPADILKIDKSFVMELSKNKEDKTIVRSMIELAHNMGLVVVAEGVEDKLALDILVENHCDYVQGYFISRPLPVSELDEWLESSEWGWKNNN